MRISTHLRIKFNNIEGAGVIAHVLKLEDLPSAVFEGLASSQSPPHFSKRVLCEPLPDPVLW